MEIPPLPIRLAAEVVGTFGFFFLGFSGIAAGTLLPGSIGSAGIAAGFGLGLGLMIAAFGHISGGHYNPAVSLGLVAAGRFPSAEVIPYWVAQLIGGFAATLAAWIVYGGTIKDNLVNAPGPGIADWRALLAETIATFLFLLVIATVASDDGAPWKGVMAPVLIGGFIFTAAVVIGPISGGSFNPARSICPAITDFEFSNLWIYIVGPLVGGLLGGAVNYSFRFVKAETV